MFMKVFENASPLTPLQFGLIFLGILVLSAILFILTGFIHVKKGRVAIIERVGLFVGIFKPGFYFFAPIVYRRVGMYRVGEIKENYEYKRENYRLSYEIVDVKTYHYIGKHDIEGILMATLKDSDTLSETLTKRCEKIGVRFIQLEKLKSAK
jgi:hypothetical protein